MRQDVEADGTRQREENYRHNQPDKRPWELVAAKGGVDGKSSNGGSGRASTRGVLDHAVVQGCKQKADAACLAASAATVMATRKRKVTTRTAAGVKPCQGGGGLQLVAMLLRGAAYTNSHKFELFLYELIQID